VIALLLSPFGGHAASTSNYLEKQKTMIERAITSHGLEVTRTVTVVKGKEGIFSSNEFKAVLSAIESREVDGLVCADLDRLAGLKDTGAIAALDVFIKCKCKIFTGKCIYDFGVKDASIHFSIALMVAGHDRKIIAQRARQSRLKNTHG